MLLCREFKMKIRVKNQWELRKFLHQEIGRWGKFHFFYLSKLKHEKAILNKKLSKWRICWKRCCVLRSRNETESNAASPVDHKRKSARVEPVGAKVLPRGAFFSPTHRIILHFRHFLVNKSYGKLTIFVHTKTHQRPSS